jgi:glycosyltransferase involved in cell wall biosynthesis
MRIIMPVWHKDPDLVTLTENAINSLRENDVKITIIDNGSSYGGGQLRQWADEYVRNPVNLGYAKAVNQGLKLHMDELVAVVNNDIRVSKNWIDVANEIMKDPLVCSVHFRMIPYDQPWNPGNETWISGKERWCSSSFFVVRGGQLYDEHFLNTYDDWDYWKTWRGKGFKQAYTNKAEYQHADSSTVNRMEKHEVTNIENREYFKKKWKEYPELDFERSFPEQLKQPWKPMP